MACKPYLEGDLPTGEPRPLALFRPSPFFFTGEDQLEIWLLSSFDAVAVTVAGMFLTLEGELVPFSFVVTNLVATQPSVLRQFVGTGFLVHLALLAQGSGVPTNGIYAQVFHARGSLTSIGITGVILQGYLADGVPLGWHGTHNPPPTDGAGQYVAPTGDLPAPGSPGHLGPPGGVRWQLLGVTSTFAASGAAANRLLTVQVGSTTQYAFPTAITAGQGGNISLFPGAPGPLAIPIAPGAFFFVGPLPEPCILARGDVVKIGAVAIDAGDQVGQFAANALEWVDLG